MSVAARKNPLSPAPAQEQIMAQAQIAAQAQATAQAGAAGIRGRRHLEARLAQALAQGSRGVIPFLTAGDPDVATTVEAIVAMADAGADAVEVGFPFSDPLADGPVIQAASQRSLAAGFRVADAWRLAREVRQRTDVPLIAFTYYNPVLATGIDRFAAEAAAAGYDAILVPDLPREEADPLLEACRREGLAWIPLVAPTTPEVRLEPVLAEGSGFVYCITVTGVTGARARLSEDLAPLVERVRRHTKLPAAAGFGISGPDQARQASRVADAIVIGSALIERMQAAGSPSSAVAAARDLVAELKQAVCQAAGR